MSGKKNIIISSGFSNFQLINTGKLLFKKKILHKLILGAYPTKNEVFYLTKFFNRFVKIKKFINRDIKINLNYIIQNRFTELINHFGLFINKFLGQKKLSQKIILFAMKFYSRNCYNFFKTKKIKNNIYHFRAGFGGKSILEAKKFNNFVICDHSIVHPIMLNHLINNKGKFPKKLPKKPTGVWRQILDDINLSDLVIVNSHFVLKTFNYLKFPKKKIKVLYQGISKKFIRYLPKKRLFADEKKIVNILFAGAIEKRKGLDEIQKTIKKLNNNFSLKFAGQITKKFRYKYKELFLDKRVKYLGSLTQKELAEEMSNSDIFLFPSLAEGSANVIFEAMASGCAIITTPNSGSIVKNNHNGFIINPGDTFQLKQKLNYLINNKKKIRLFGKNAQIDVKKNYTEQKYLEGLLKIYKNIV